MSKYRDIATGLLLIAFVNLLVGAYIGIVSLAIYWALFNIYA